MADGDVDTDSDQRGWKLRTVDSIYKMLEDEHGKDVVIDYLKMDVESTECKAIPQMLNSGIMRKVKQFALEIHLKRPSSLDQLRQRVKIIKSLEDNGFVRFSSRANTVSADMVVVLGQMDYYAYELAWYNSNFTAS